jgi:hypothetical protein
MTLLKIMITPYRDEEIDCCGAGDQKGGTGLAHLQKYVENLGQVYIINFEKVSSPLAYFSTRSALCRQRVRCPR